MAIATLSNVLRFFGGGEPTQEEREELFKEAILMTLARATSADTRIRPVEVRTVQGVLRRMTGEDFSETDIRMAAHSELYEKASIEKYLGSTARKLEVGDRIRIVRALAEVIKSDEHVNPLEAKFFNEIADSMRLTPAQLVGLDSP